MKFQIEIKPVEDKAKVSRWWGLALIFLAVLLAAALAK